MKAKSGLTNCRQPMQANDYGQNGVDADWQTPGDCMAGADQTASELATARSEGRMTFSDREQIRAYLARTSGEYRRAA